MKKYLGYLIAVIGLVLLASTMVAQLKLFILTSLSLQSSTFVNDTLLIVVGLVLVILGIIMASKSPSRNKVSKKGLELPIYHGKDIVGYRRH